MGQERARDGDRELVASVLQGRLEAFDELVARHQRQASAVAQRLLNNRDDALEVVQEAFLAAYEKLRTLDDPARFKSWLLRIVSNLALNRRRGRALRRTASLDATPPAADDGGHMDLGPADPRAATAEQHASAGEMQAIIDETIRAMSPLQAQALLLFVQAEMPQKDIAEVLGCSVEAVKWHVFAARKKLKEALKDYL
jgi:RNA polymerase sigma-70 factor (ECF subfamily)